MKKSSRGSALLSILWLSAALSAIAFSLAVTVRGETEHTSNIVDGLRCYYLATAGVERAAMELLWSSMGGNRIIPKGANHVDYVLPSGNVRVEIIPETAKLDLNHASVADLERLMTALGVPSGRAEEIAAAINDWRQPGSSSFDGFYGGQTPSFRAPHASFQEIEELLSVRGVTPEIFYGTWSPAGAFGGSPAGLDPLAPGARLVRHSGLVDCVTVYNVGSAVDANTAAPEVLAAVGVPDFGIQTILELRREAPLTMDQLSGIGAGPASGRLRLEGNTIVTFRATARLRTADGHVSDLRRTVAAQVKYVAYGSEIPYHILRWYDTAWSN